MENLTKWNMKQINRRERTTKQKTHTWLNIIISFIYKQITIQSTVV